MSDFYKKFLRDEGRRGGEKDNRQLYLGALGKHPGWNDHIDDIPLETESLVLLKSILYVQGIGGMVDQADWDKPEAQKDLIEFNHYFLWQRGDQFILGRLWASRDGRGRAKYPMIICAHCVGLSLPWALKVILPKLDEVKSSCQTATTADEVRQIIITSQSSLRDLISRQSEDLALWDGLKIDRPGFLERPDLGPEGLGLKRILHEMRSNFFAFKDPKAFANLSAVNARAQVMRAPRNAPDCAEAMLSWNQFFYLQYPRVAPMLLLAPADNNWVDLCVGEPTPGELFGLRTASLGLASSTPYQLGPDIDRDCATVLDAFKRGVATLVTNDEKTSSSATIFIKQQMDTVVSDTPGSKKLYIVIAVVGGAALLLLALVFMMLSGSNPPKPPPAPAPKPAQPTAAIPEPPPKPKTTAPPEAVKMSTTSAPAAQGQGLPPVTKTLSARGLLDGLVVVGLDAKNSQGQPLTYTVVEDVKNGKATVDGAEFRYRPKPGFSGVDRFLCKGNGAGGEIVSFDVTIRVVASEKAPEVKVTQGKGIQIDQRKTIQIVGEDQPIQPFDLQVSDDLTAPDKLKTTVTSGDVSFLPVANIRIKQDGGHWLIQPEPVSKRGTAEFRLVVTDQDENSVTNEFMVTVTKPSNTPPKILALNQREWIVEEGEKVPLFRLAVFDEQSAPEKLTFTLESSDTRLLPVGNIQVDRQGTNWLLTVAPAAKQTGASEIKLKVNDDGGMSSSFTLRVAVKPFHQPPQFVKKIEKTILLEQGQRERVETIIVSNPNPTPGNVALTAVTAPVDLAQVTVSDGGAAGTKKLVFSAAQSKPSKGTVYIIANDGQKSATNVVALEVLAAEAPKFVKKPNLEYTKEEGETLGPIEVSVSDNAADPEQLKAAAYSRNAAAIPSANVTLAGSNPNWQVTVKTVSGKANDVTIDLMATDLVGLSATNSFVVHVIESKHRSSIGMEFAWVPGLPGTEPANWKGRKTGGGWVGVFEVMQSEFESVMKTNSSAYKQGGKYPVEMVGIADAEKFCAALTELDKAILPAGWGYRLPTEQEWFFFCGGANTNSAARINAVTSFARKDAGEKAREHAEPVGSVGKPNRFGLFDLIGNVFEWAWRAPGSPVICGGDYTAVTVNITERGFTYSPGPAPNVGFRCLLVPLK